MRRRSCLVLKFSAVAAAALAAWFEADTPVEGRRAAHLLGLLKCGTSRLRAAPAGSTLFAESVLCARGFVVARASAFHSLSKYLRFARTRTRGWQRGPLRVRQAH